MPPHTRHARRHFQHLRQLQKELEKLEDDQSDNDFRQPQLSVRQGRGGVSGCSHGRSRWAALFRSALRSQRSEIQSNRMLDVCKGLFDHGEELLPQISSPSRHHPLMQQGMNFRVSEDFPRTPVCWLRRPLPATAPMRGGTGSGDHKARIGDGSSLPHCDDKSETKSKGKCKSSGKSTSTAPALVAAATTATKTTQAKQQQQRQQQQPQRQPRRRRRTRTPAKQQRRRQCNISNSSQRHQLGQHDATQP